MTQIILASQSRARKELVSSLGIAFITLPAHIDEKSFRDVDLKIRAEKLARAKAEKISSENNAIIIACDTFSESDGKVFEKPSSKKEAIEMLTLLSGKEAINYTGFCYIDRKNNIDFSTTVIVPYSLRILYPQEIELYVNSYPVTEWAAGFALVEPYITSFIASVNGSYTGLAYGLPTELLIPLLKKSGFEPEPGR
ncbi:MAG: Maf family protein [Candidatus Levybacteria bacterium]|nr:Maf family protein [Candidatus Levybacteria bacterium]